MNNANRGKQQNRKTGDLQENWRYHGNIVCKDGTIKDRKVKGLTEADEIKKRQQECTEELYKNGHNDPDRDDVWVTYVKPDILEHEVKWALGSTTTSKAS